jgi:tetratricopeptide (TPR) repeat protein
VSQVERGVRKVDRMSVLETVGHAGRYTDLTVLLRGLVPDLETAARALPETQRAEVYELMAATYQACSAALAKLGEPEAAYSHLDQAAEAAGRLGEGRNEYNTEFGPANVALHEIAVAVELGDAGRALRAAEAVDDSGLSAERRARMLIDVARAHAQRRQVGEALAALREAEQITPEQVRGHELVRQLVSDLLTMHDPPSSELRDLAARLGAVRGL